MGTSKTEQNNPPEIGLYTNLIGMVADRIESRNWAKESETLELRSSTSDGKAEKHYAHQSNCAKWEEDTETEDWKSLKEWMDARE